MITEMAGDFAGRIWNALNETEGLTLKEIKKATKLKDKELYLGLGWLLREDKVFSCVAEEEEIFALK
ncbi:MAG: winged helix-turn-helix domain-containing protein [Bacteroidaceae bacterium]|nr:winged helix-turn-helix domain-containing protein [Bacteroidaceae bacterium]MBQ8270607.1 winged helix-turn-helix domain-containing protein [Bacteroidaceae bacterium]